MKSITILLSILVSLNAFAGTEDWCVWDNEAYLKKAVQEDKKTWVGAVYELLINGDDLKTDFEGLGSCRFFPSSTGKDLGEAVANFSKAYPVATTAYLKVTGNVVKLVVPSATFGAGTNLVTFNKDFYSMDKAICEEQKADVLELGRQSKGIEGLDIQFKDNKNDGVALAITPSTTTTRSYGVCNFYPIK